MADVTATGQKITKKQFLIQYIKFDCNMNLDFCETLRRVHRRTDPNKHTT